MKNSERGVVGFDASALESERPAGVSWYTIRLLEALIERQDGWKYVLLSGKPLRVGIPKGVSSQSTSRFPNKTLWMQIVLPLVLARLRPQLCHFTNFVAPLKTPCPYVVTVHDMSLFLHGETHTRRSLWAVRSLLPSVARRAAAIITVSESARRDILSILGVSPAKVTVIHEAAAEAYRVIHQPEALRRVSEAYALRDPFILSVGTLEPRKNLERLLAAYAALRGKGHREHLVIVGQSGWKFKSLLSAIENQGMGDYVRVLGYVPDADMPMIYNLARVLAFPSIYEGFGLPILEAMACGTPVLTSNCSSMPEVAGDAAVLVDPLSQDSIEAGLCRILGDASLREQLRDAGLKRAANFSWARAAAETTRVYESLLRRRS